MKLSRPASIAVILLAGSALGLCSMTGSSGCSERDRPPSITDAKPVPPRPLRVLFVGNSHTYINDVPKLVSELATADSTPRPLQYESVAEGGIGLREHLAAGRVQAKLGQRWDYVVLQEQQQRQALTFDPDALESEFYAPARELNRLVRDSGATSVLYMTWARREGDPEGVPGDTYAQMHDRTRLAVSALARELRARIAPVGEAWHWALDQRADLALWQPDGSHASLLGSYLAACVLYATLFGRDVQGNGFQAGLPPSDAELAQRAADIARRSF